MARTLTGSYRLFSGTARLAGHTEEPGSWENGTKHWAKKAFLGVEVGGKTTGLVA